MADQPPPSPPITVAIVPPSPPPRPLLRRWSHFRTVIVTVLLSTGFGYLLVKYFLPTREWYVGENPSHLTSSLDGETEYIEKHGDIKGVRNEEYFFAILGSKLPPGGKVRLFNEAVRYSNLEFVRDNPLIRGYLVLLIEVLLSAEPDSRDGQLEAIQLLNHFAIAGSKWIDPSDVKDEWSPFRNPFAHSLQSFFESQSSQPLNIHRFLTSMSAQTRAAVLDLYLRRGWSPPENDLLPALRDSDVGVRKRAFATARRLWPQEVQDELIRGIDDPDPEIARLAVRSLGASLSGESRRLAAEANTIVAEQVRTALIGLLFTQAELDAIPAEVRARSRWQTPDPMPIPGERRPAKLRAQAVLSLGQMTCTAESVAAILRSLSGPFHK